MVHGYVARQQLLESPDIAPTGKRISDGGASAVISDFETPFPTMTLRNRIQRNNWVLTQVEKEDRIGRVARIVVWDCPLDHTNPLASFGRGMGKETDALARQDS